MTAILKWNKRNLGHRKLVCKRGHPFTPENTAWRQQPNGHKSRACIECKKINSKLWYLANKVAKL